MAERTPASGGGFPPLFLVGCGRSGTTMLRLMLDSHPAISIPGESHFIPGTWKGRRNFQRNGSLDAEALARHILKTPQVQRWDLNPERVIAMVTRINRPTFSDVVETVFGAYADKHDKPRWGDKTPIYVTNVKLLAELFPEARFVHLIRDGRDVATSYLSVPWGPGSIYEAARKWRRDVRAGRSAGSSLSADRYLEVRYEELVAETQSVLKHICEFADLPFDERMLDYHKDAEGRIQSQPKMASFHGSVARPPTGGLRDWRSQMPRTQLATFEIIAGKLLGELGYERATARGSPALRITTRVRLAALELRNALGASRRALARFIRSVAAT